MRCLYLERFDCDAGEVVKVTTTGSSQHPHRPQQRKTQSQDDPQGQRATRPAGSRVLGKDWNRK